MVDEGGSDYGKFGVLKCFVIIVEDGLEVFLIVSKV